MSNSHPWYDSQWLAQYEAAKGVIERLRPEILAEFVAAFEILRTRQDFKVTELGTVFDAEVMGELERVVRELQPTELELHEAVRFGRFIVHDHPFVTELQRSITDRASDAAGEPIEPCYNFLSLYSKLGVCPVHMDSPQAKWTIDLCIRQSKPWPIYMSQTVPWPEDTQYDGDDWEGLIRDAPDLEFVPYSLEPGKAILFSGSSQWHYRDPHPGGADQFCDLVFFHFVPVGTRELVEPRNWSELFEVPELADIRSPATPSRFV